MSLKTKREMPEFVPNKRIRINEDGDHITSEEQAIIHLWMFFDGTYQYPINEEDGTIDFGNLTSEQIARERMCWLRSKNSNS